MSYDILPEGDLREKASISSVHVEPEMEGGYANAWISVEIENHTDEDLDVVATITVALGDNQEKIEVIDQISPEGGVLQGVIRIEEPELWWPYILGTQTLYTCMVGLESDGDIQDVSEQNFGVRSVQWLESGVISDSPALLINGEEISLPESCWAPLDTFEPEADEENYKKTVQQVVDEGWLIVAAWGRGSDEDSAFYDACDERGVLVWQELLPEAARISKAFADKAVEGVRETVTELRNHVCLMGWSGVVHCDQKSDNPAADRLIEEVIPSVLKQMDSTRTYRPRYCLCAH
jgi:beta-mannosidase